MSILVVYDQGLHCEIKVKNGIDTIFGVFCIAPSYGTYALRLYVIFKQIMLALCSLVNTIKQESNEAYSAGMHTIYYIA